MKSATLGKNGTEHLLRLDRDKCKFPIVLSFNFMVCIVITEREPRKDACARLRDSQNLEKAFLQGSSEGNGF